MLRLCVACKKRLQFFYASRKEKFDETSKFMELYSDLELSDTPRTLEFTRDNLVVFSLRKEFFYYELPSNSANASQAPEARFGTGTRAIDPLCQKLYNDSFVIGVDENKTIMYDSSGSPSLGYPIKWSATPSLVTAVGFYLVGILAGVNRVEVVTIEPETVSVQYVNLMETGSDLLSVSSSMAASSLGKSKCCTKI